MNKTTTALTKVIEDIDMVINSERFESSDADTLRKTIKMLQASAIYQLQKDREDIQQAYTDGIVHRSEFKCKLPQDYFTKSFTQYKTETNG